MTKIYCPSCGAGLEMGNEIRFCPYCGSPLLGQSINERREYIYRNIDEAEIRKEEYRTYIRKTELEHDDLRNKILLVFLGLYTLITLVIIIIAIIGTLKESENSKYIWFIVGVMISLPIMVFLTKLLSIRDDSQLDRKTAKGIIILWMSYLALAGIIFLVISGSKEVIFVILGVGLIATGYIVLYKLGKD
ncbi:MAG: hypothetical protein IKP88_18300 [Lachnospiraceae bacterium]|nr:hypothetical protein [Lachnospiraceae bacterium]